jgi:hypothetical protein
MIEAAPDAGRFCGPASQTISPWGGGEAFARRPGEATERDPGAIPAQRDTRRAFAAAGP